MRERIELVERLKALSGPDREVDYLIFRLFAEKEHSNTWDPKQGHQYTASLDAAAALVEGKMPGWGYYLRSDKEGHGCGLVYPDAFRVTPCHCQGATPAIAMVLALLTALGSDHA